MATPQPTVTTAPPSARPLLWTILFLLSACTITGEGASAADPDFAEMIETRYAQPFRTGDLERWLEVFAEDATALHNRRPADVGKPAIAAFGQLVFSTFRAQTFELKVREVRRQGDWVMTWGDFRSLLVNRATGEPAPWGPESGKFLFMWERGADGVWRIVVDMGNSGSDQFEAGE
jgi:ketosteroid isomerase-like protein